MRLECIAMPDPTQVSTGIAASTAGTRWEAGLKPLKAIHHQAGNHLVSIDGDSADAFCYGIASRYRPNCTGE